MNRFRYPGLSLNEAIDALKAYDSGALDSGISDVDLRGAVQTYLKTLEPDDLRRVLAEHARTYLTDEAIERGCGVEDVLSLVEWLDSLGVRV